MMTLDQKKEVSTDTITPQIVNTTKVPISIDIPDYGICIGESHHHPNFTMEPMYNYYTKIYYVVEGVADCYVNSKPIHLEKDYLFVIPTEITHYLKDQDKFPLCLYILAIESSCLEKLPTFCEQIALLNQLARTHLRPLTHHDYAAYEIPRMFRRILNEQRVRANGFVPAIQATLLNMLVAINRIYEHIPASGHIDSTNPTFARIHTVADYISKNFYEPISIENMAKMACLSIRQFTNQFKAVYGVTFTQYLHYHRIHFAQQMLTETNQKIATICFESGFNDLAHFYRVFKKLTKISPRKYRINSRNSINTTGKN
ncbi:helix-turn-helix transcriptional regulator [candidate division KSB1 bacterium]|nr:helix-turn-helix transcriptional regulator [candidate division KSB1 bacterium]NIV70771.1 helix-turn-helix domain-containing protein [Phycisphaerae bacterium]NIR72890.1 helix-turn-helix transcriptional regulator [candidate division KSB1 bacterium]NIT73688.1 helix-turn-helix transcriptional regulator [candidate division KSB1 bacterium]NIU27560.1 helix-turn-helix transcriptional regulator [candidate division KSB1 bacterium]